MRVIGLIPAVENLPGGNATKPGDVVKSLLGKTIEIINTDAEGRLILADALAYARTLGATRLIDIATLTGACVVALGQVNAGMMGTDQEIIERLRGAASITGEKFWQLPLDDEYRKVDPQRDCGYQKYRQPLGRSHYGRQIPAGICRKDSLGAPGHRGSHLDHDGQPFAAKGATGFGVRSLVHLLTKNHES